MVIDSTRCHLKLAHIAKHTSIDSVVHLHRSRRGFVTSHLLPNRTDPVGRVRKQIRKRNFFTRSGDYDGWGMQMLVGRAAGSPLSILLDEAGYQSSLLYDLPAAGRLMVLWDFFCREAEAVGQQQFPGRFASVRFEEFTEAPAAVANKMSDALGIPAQPTLSRPKIRTAAEPYSNTNERWIAIEKQASACLPEGEWWDARNG